MTFYQLVKKRCSGAGWALLIYHGIFSVLVTVIMMVPMFSVIIESALSGVEPSGAAMDAVYEGMLQNAWGYLLAVAVGFTACLIWKKKDFCFHTVFHPGKAMTVGSFVSLFCLATTSQMVFSILNVIIEILLNQVGLSAQSSAEAASITANSLSMFLYAGIAAPIFEEFFFRGVILRHIQPYGKHLAVFASAFLFGMFHGNIVQSPFAFCVGLVYGYITVEYSILWAMLLHMLNNLLLGDMLSRIATLTGDGPINILFALIIYGSTIASIVILIVRRKEVGAWFRENRAVPGSWKAFFAAPGVLVFNIYMVINIIAGLLMEAL